MTDDQMTREDVARLTQQRRYDDIEQARRDGRLDRILGASEPELALLHKARHDVIDRADITDLTRLGRQDLIEAARLADRIAYDQEN